MTKQERLFLIHEAILSSEMEVSDLIELLELDTYELIKLIPNHLLQMEHKFVLPSIEEEEDDEEDWDTIIREAERYEEGAIQSGEPFWSQDDEVPEE